MNLGRTVYVQLLAFIPICHFQPLVDVFQANKGVSAFSVWSH